MGSTFLGIQNQVENTSEWPARMHIVELLLIYLTNSSHNSIYVCPFVTQKKKQKMMEQFDNWHPLKTSNIKTSLGKNLLMSSDFDEKIYVETNPIVSYTKIAFDFSVQ